MRRLVFIVIILSIYSAESSAQVTENFNHGDRSVSNANCWQTWGVDIQTETWAINPAGDAPMLRSSALTGAQLVSPFVKFNGTGVITFRHKVNNVSSAPSLSLILLDASGTVVQTLLSHNYNAGNTFSESIKISWTGIYQLRWEWTGTGGSSRGGIDDIRIHGSYASDSAQNSMGDCPAMTVPTDSVCAGSNDVPYQIYDPVASSYYTWFLSDASSGTIDLSLTANNREVEIDWGSTTGSNVLYVFETSSEGCIGDTVSMNIEIIALPTVSITADTVCEGLASTVTFEFTGKAPWIVDYADENNSFSDTCWVSPCSFPLPAYSSNVQIDVLGVEDNNGCNVDPTNLPSTTVHINPKPSTGYIYH